ncbi:3-oxoacyl-[acyl-carrier-protein] synthase III C-terminal domain-containing protein [Micromonospora sp. WMMD1102]|uniref:3-oxoacyl-ACP synthase III family protein n=1 Tax=Micromonospora sp. WMMD1102 TaxID=3016105 RepID=UPI002414D067|nr:3-oxoacyl-[acyl-carrier-protein] synthase III C-terminal domain-containing protein [Micromonospora sp. WMMD1102]MDG4787860.1 3-oxoacyl-[acyl-carrier-protein] synthase III C-terminal domain-containing protein [Micromonospora sp. WMMD1102]
MTEPVTSLLHVEGFAPERSWAVEEIAEANGLNRHQARMFRRIRGLDRIHLDPDMDLFDLLAAPAEKVLRTVPDPERVRYLIYAHTFPDLTPSFVYAADRLRERLGLTCADAFAVTHQMCASNLAALDVAGELLRADGDPDALALVVTGEKPFTGLVRYMLNVSVTGEGSAACLLGIGGTGSRILSYAAHTAGEFADGFRMTVERQREFDDTYNIHLWEMMQEALRRAGLDISDIAMVVPHNVNRTLWLRLCAKIGLDRSRVFLDNIARYSHTYCSDPFINLATMRERGLLIPGQRYLLTSVGVGATYAAMVIEY